jgi:MarR family transcriptional regulator, transcriptional regulator for hemolysin
MDDRTETSRKSLGFLLSDAARLLRRRFDQEARDIPMTGAQLRIVGQLMRNEGISQSALAQLLEIEPMTLCRHVDRMEAAGFVERRQDEADRRIRRLYTTPKSRDLIAPMRAHADRIYEVALSGLSPAERHGVVGALERIVANLSTAQPAQGDAHRREQETA